MFEALQGCVAIVTGGAKGIGEATVRQLTALGVRIVIADLDVAAGEALARELPGSAFIRTDVTSEDQVAAAVQLAESRFGGLDIMINNAGLVGAVGSICETSYADWSKTMAVLLDGVFYGAKHAARVMVPRRSGVILSLSSAAGLRGGLGPHAYSVAKHGIVGLTVSLASELSAHGIRVNAVAPGLTVTPLISTMFGGQDAAISHAAASSSLKTAMMPEEIASVLVFLASSSAAHITGQVISVDSGLTTTSREVPRFHTLPPGFIAASTL